MSNTATATEVKPTLTWGFGDETFEDEYDVMCDELTALMQKINKGGQWYATVKNQGWMLRSGWTSFKATDAHALLARICHSDSHFKLFVEGKGFGRYFRIQHFHHDSPTGAEWYEVRRFNGRIHPAS